MIAIYYYYEQKEILHSWKTIIDFYDCKRKKKEDNNNNRFNNQHKISKNEKYAAKYLQIFSLLSELLLKKLGDNMFCVK